MNCHDKQHIVFYIAKAILTKYQAEEEENRRKHQNHCGLTTHKALQNATLFATIVYGVWALSVLARLFVLLAKQLVFQDMLAINTYWSCIDE